VAITSTRTTTLTSTFTKILYVTQKVQADLLSIQDLYEFFPEGYAQNIIHDIRHFLDEEVIDKVKFTWIEDGGIRVLEELEYKVIRGGIGLADERPGGIWFRWDLANAEFSVRITYNNRWNQMEGWEKAEVRKGLKLNWGPAGQLDYSGGQWITDRTYSKNGYGLTRRGFTSR
jgi:hypothetical protein